MVFHKSFAVVGFGTVGSLILAEFVKGEEKNPRGLKLRVLTRESSTQKPQLAEYATKGVEIVGVDYSSSESIERALQGVDVVISTLRDDGLDLQTEVIKAAKSAGVKLFAPSEYGINTLGAKHEYLKVKADAHDLLKKLKLPYALFFIGLFPELFFPNGIGPLIGIDFEKGKFELFGDGNAAASYTSPRSIAPYVHHVLTTLPASDLENRVFKIEGDRKTWQEIIKVWESKHNQKAQVHCRTEGEIREFQAAQASPLSPLLILLSNAHKTGGGVTGGDDNALWPDWNPLKWEDVMY